MLANVLDKVCECWPAGKCLEAIIVQIPSWHPCSPRRRVGQPLGACRHWRAAGDHGKVIVQSATHLGIPKLLHTRQEKRRSSGESRALLR